MKIKIFIIISILFISISAFSQQIGDGRASEITDFTVPLKSGGFQAYNPIGGNPDIVHGWQHLFVLRHSNDSNNHQLQLSSGYAENDRLFFRKIVSGGLGAMNPTWIELATRGANNLNGDQKIKGSISSSMSNDSGGHIDLINPSKMSNGIAKQWTIYNMTGVYGNSLQFFAYDNLSCAGGGMCTNRFTIGDNGNVGIGTTVPNSKLVIAAGTDAVSLHAGTVNCLGFNRNASDGAIFNASKSAWQFSARDEMFTLEGYNGAPHSLFTVLKNGYIGMGTNSPGCKLDVIGTIRAREIKVDLGGADFVFENGYKLMPLSELEKFVKDKKHLPEIATAKEMQENGANLGDLNTKLLQKIEELTLYTIEQNKKLEKQNEKILVLEDKVKKIETASK